MSLFMVSESQQCSDQQGRMLTVVTVLLLLNHADCDESTILEQTTVSPGEDVTLTCERESLSNLFWIRLGLDGSHDAFGKSVSSYTKHPRVKIKSENGEFSLHLSKVKVNDTAVFICVEIIRRTWSFLKRAELTVTDLTKPVHPGTTESLNPHPTQEDFISCFPSGKFQSRPGSVLTEGNHEYDCGDEHEGQSRTKCVYSFFMNISLSDRGGLWSVTSCGERSGHGAADKSPDLLKSSIISILGAALTVALMVIIFLLHSNKKLKNAAALRADSDENQQADSVTYSTPTHFKHQSREKRGRNVSPPEQQCIYTSVRTNR